MVLFCGNGKRLNPLTLFLSRKRRALRGPLRGTPSAGPLRGASSPECQAPKMFLGGCYKRFWMCSGINKNAVQ